MDKITPPNFVPTPPAPPLLTPAPRDWLFLLGVILFGGSSFSGIRIAVETAPPSVVAAGRLWVAALLLLAYSLGTGRSLPALIEKGKPSVAWIFAGTIGAAGYAIPMFLFPFAQQSVSSLLAGIYMAFMPIVTVALAAIFADEPLTRNKIMGTLIGLFGVMVLILPSLPQGGLDAGVIAQLALILATTGYAVSSVITRRAPDVPARSFGAMIMLMAALLSTPAAVTSLMHAEEPVSAASMAAIVYLGVLPTGISTIFIIHMVRSAGASFLAVGNYVTPAAAIFFGVLLFREELTLWHVGGLATILTGVFVTQPGPLLSMLQKLRERG